MKQWVLGFNFSMFLKIVLPQEWMHTGMHTYQYVTSLLRRESDACYETGSEKNSRTHFLRAFPKGLCVIQFRKACLVAMLQAKAQLK